MAYRNKTFVSFASEDLHCYRLMQAWKENQHIDFNFYDAHDLNTARDTSQIATIERRLGERLANTKQVIMLIGGKTKRKAEDGVSFIHHEVNVIKRLRLPVIFANLNQVRESERSRIPEPLLDLYTISVSFQPAIIKYALDEFVEAFYENERERDAAKRRTGLHHYKNFVYENLGLARSQ